MSCSASYKDLSPRISTDKDSHKSSGTEVRARPQEFCSLVLPEWFLMSILLTTVLTSLVVVRLVLATAALESMAPASMIFVVILSVSVCVVSMTETLQLLVPSSPQDYLAAKDCSALPCPLVAPPAITCVFRIFLWGQLQYWLQYH